MRKVLIASALLLVMPLLAVQAAPPALPASYYGTVRINGALAPEGAVITALVNGVECARAAVLRDETYGSVYALNVPGADPEMLTSVGGAAGERVTFTLELPGGEVYALPQVSTWGSGDFRELNLRYPPECVVLPLIVLAH
jgi:hypothetical protein